MIPVYLANVQLAFKAHNDAEACDAVSAMLSLNLQHCKAILDWQYIEKGAGIYEDPVYVGEHPESCDEGEIFSRIKSYLTEKRVYVTPAIRLSRYQFTQMGERKFIFFYLKRSYYWNFGTMKGFPAWEKSDPLTYHAAVNFAADLYENVVNATQRRIYLWNL